MGKSIVGSINSQSHIKKQLNYTSDEFSLNCELNKILKSTLNLVIKANISKERKKKLKKTVNVFRDVDWVDVKNINWKIQFDRNNRTYRMLVNICYLIIMGLIQTEKSGNVKLMDFEDDQLMSSLYEKFLLNYFKKEHPDIKTHAPQIDWQIDEGWDVLLPKMKTDVTLEYENRILIIDAKFYKDNLVENYGSCIAPVTYTRYSHMLKISKPNFKEKTLKSVECYYMQGLKCPFNQIVSM